MLPSQAQNIHSFSSGEKKKKEDHNKWKTTKKKQTSHLQLIPADE